MSFDPKFIRLLSTQILIGEPLGDHVPKLWWRSLQAAALWNIWLSRNEEVIANLKVPFEATKGKIWSQIRLDLKSEWQRRQEQVQSGTISKDRVRFLFQFDFGENELVYTIRENKLKVARVPPELD